MYGYERIGNKEIEGWALLFKLQVWTGRNDVSSHSYNKYSLDWETLSEIMTLPSDRPRSPLNIILLKTALNQHLLDVERMQMPAVSTTLRQCNESHATKSSDITAITGHQRD